MAVDRILRWVCDACGRIEDLKRYGLPLSWMWSHERGQEVKHACPECLGKMSDQERSAYRVSPKMKR